MDIPGNDSFTIITRFTLCVKKTTTGLQPKDAIAVIYEIFTTC